LTAYFTNLLIDILVFWYQVLARLHEAGFHVDIDISDRTIQKKVLPCGHSILAVSFGFFTCVSSPLLNKNSQSLDKKLHVASVFVSCVALKNG